MLQPPGQLTGCALWPSSLPSQLVRQVLSVVNLSQRFDDTLRVNGDGACFLLREKKVEHERMDVAVENYPHQLGIPVDDRAAGVAPDDVGGADEIEGRVQIEPALALDPEWREIKRRFVMVRGGPRVK